MLTRKTQGASPKASPTSREPWVLFKQDHPKLKRVPPWSLQGLSACKDLGYGALPRQPQALASRPGASSRHSHSPSAGLPDIPGAAAQPSSAACPCIRRRQWPRQLPPVAGHARHTLLHPRLLLCTQGTRRRRLMATPLPPTDSAVGSAVTGAAALQTSATPLPGAKTAGSLRCLPQRALLPGRALRYRAVGLR